MTTYARRSRKGDRRRMPRPQDVVDLIVTSGYPCISVLMRTEPGDRMAPDDVTRLRGLIDTVESKLRDQGVTGTDRLVSKLNALAARTAADPADRGLALFVNLAVARAFQLPLPVPAQAIVEGTFATRALVTTLHRLPQHVVLVLDDDRALLYQSLDGRLRKVGSRRPAPRRGTDPGTPDLEGYLRGVDHMLGSFRSAHPSPLVLCGTPALVARFHGVSRNLHRLAGDVALDGHRGRGDLAGAAAALVEAYLRSRRGEALKRLEQAIDERPADVACGMAECWALLRRRSPAMLLVEEDFVCPGRLDADGLPAPADEDGDHRSAVHDLVDDLIEGVLIRGGHLALVPPGDLGERGGVVLLAEPRRR